MAETVQDTKADKPAITPELVGTLEKSLASQNELLTKQQETIDALNKRVEEVAKIPVHKGFNPASLYGSAGPHVTTGALGERGYSLMKAQKFALNLCDESEAKEEVQISNKLKKMYDGYKGFEMRSGRKMLIPWATQYMLPEKDHEHALVQECRQKMAAGIANVDPDEVAWLKRKALGTIDDLAGGALVAGPPLAAELIELQRNMEVFPQIGARETALPPNGRIEYSKQTAGATFYWVGEGSNITESEPDTGNLLLEAKKGAVLVKTNNELFRFANPAAEALIRQDCAAVAARGIDLAMLEGTGGTRIKGIITYSTIGTLTASTVEADGNTFQPQDVARMEGQLPDAVPEFTAYVMRRAMAVAITNRRADAALAGDQAGAFMFSRDRAAGMGVARDLGGTKLVRSAQVSATRTKGSASNLTYILGCYGPDWIIARFGVAELMMAREGDTAFVADQTWLRLIQHIDAGPRHAESFVLCDQLKVQ